MRALEDARERRSRRAPLCSPELVRSTSPRPPVAALARSVRDLGERGDVAADAGLHRHPLLAPVPGALSDGGVAGPRGVAGGVGAVARARVLRPGAPPRARWPRSPSARRRRWWTETWPACWRAPSKSRAHRAIAPASEGCGRW